MGDQSTPEQQLRNWLVSEREHYRRRAEREETLLLSGRRSSPEEHNYALGKATAFEQAIQRLDGIFG